MQSFRVNNPYTSRVIEAANIDAALDRIRPEFSSPTVMRRGYTQAVERIEDRLYLQVRNTKGRTVTGCVIYPERSEQ